MDRNTNKNNEERCSLKDESPGDQLPARKHRTMPLIFKDPLLGLYKVGSRFRNNDAPEEGHIMIQLSIPAGENVASVSPKLQTKKLPMPTRCNDQAYTKHLAREEPTVRVAAQTHGTLNASQPSHRMDFASIVEWMATNDIMEPYVEPAPDARAALEVKERTHVSYSTMAAWNAFLGASDSNEHAVFEGDNVHLRYGSTDFS